MKKIFCLLYMGLYLLLLGCQSKNQEFTTLSVDDFAQLITDPQVQRLDVRTVAEYSSGHIPESLNVNVLDEDSFVEMASAALEKGRPVALYCRSGKRSKTAARKLSKEGFQVYELDGGYNAWKEAGKPVQP